MASEGMVGVEGDGFFGHRHNAHWHGAFGRLHLQHHIDLGLEIIGQLGTWDLANHFFALFAVSFSADDLHRLSLTDSHIAHRGIKSRNDLATANLKVDGIATFGGVKHGSVGESALVVDLDGLAFFNHGAFSVSIWVIVLCTITDRQEKSIKDELSMNRYTKPADGDYSDYLAAYLSQISADEDNVFALLHRQGAQLLQGMQSITDEQADHRYQEGKWTVKEVVGHLIDTERLFGLRALWMARGEPNQQPGMDETIWAANSNAGQRSRPELWLEHQAVRASSLFLFDSFAPADIARTGESNGEIVSVNLLPWLIAAHELHHLKVLRDRYDIDFFTNPA